MRALRIHAHGGPEVLRLEDVPVPQPGPDGVLVRLAAASVNPIDWKIREGLYPMPLPRTLGRDGAGVDESTGERLLGIVGPGRDGTHAEYAVFSRSATAPIGDALSLEEAAGLGIASLSAWIPLVENAEVKAGDRVLIHAGADFCRSLGAKEAIDYTREDFCRAGRIFDVVFDTLGGAVHRRSAEVLKPGGVLAYLNATPPEPPLRRDIRVLPTEVRATPERLKALLACGLRVPVEARFPLERAAEAYELSRSGHARGKIVLQIS